MQASSRLRCSLPGGSHRRPVPPSKKSKDHCTTKTVAPETRKRESSNAPFALYEPVTPRRLHNGIFAIEGLAS